MLKFSSNFLKNITDELAALIALELKNKDSVSIAYNAKDADNALNYIKLNNSIKELSLSAPTMENFSIDAKIHLTIGDFEGDFNITYPEQNE